MPTTPQPTAPNLSVSALCAEALARISHPAPAPYVAPASTRLTLGEHVRLNAARSFPTLFRLYGGDDDMRHAARAAISPAHDAAVTHAVEELESTLAHYDAKHGIAWLFAGGAEDEIADCEREVRAALGGAS